MVKAVKNSTSSAGGRSTGGWFGLDWTSTVASARHPAAESRLFFFLFQSHLSYESSQRSAAAGTPSIASAATAAATFFKLNLKSPEIRVLFNRPTFKHNFLAASLAPPPPAKRRQRKTLANHQSDVGHRRQGRRHAELSVWPDRTAVPWGYPRTFSLAPMIFTGCAQD